MSFNAAGAGFQLGGILNGIISGAYQYKTMKDQLARDLDSYKSAAQSQTNVQNIIRDGEVEASSILEDAHQVQSDATVAKRVENVKLKEKLAVTKAFIIAGRNRGRYSQGKAIPANM